MIKFSFCWFLLIATNTTNALVGQESLAMPASEDARIAVRKASDWLTQRVETGRLKLADREILISVIAWKDPTLNPELSHQLAGYSITDTLWASYALKLTQPKIAKELTKSLEAIGCQGNSLHEVIWRRIESVAHKPIDPDIVHGRSVGIMSTEHGKTIDVRCFTMVADHDFEAGHPALFAEHAVYQSLYEFRLGIDEIAKERLRGIFRNSTEDSPQQIRWDSHHGLLIDYVTEKESQGTLAGKGRNYRQYSFKLATLYYACRRLGLDREFPEKMKQLASRLRAAQLQSGGVAHYFDVDTTRNTVAPCPDATGEATAIFILANTLVPD